MSAIAISNFCPTRIDWRRWLSAKTAAELLGIDESSMRRKCREELQGRGFALFATPPEGGAAQWFVHRDYDARLMPAFGNDYREPDLSGFSERQRKLALERRAVVERFNHELVMRPAVDTWIDEYIARLRLEFPELKISRTGLYAWRNLYLRPADTIKLIDMRGQHNRFEDSKEAWEYFADLYCHENRPSVEQCWYATKRQAAENGWRWCTLRSCYRQKDRKIPIEQQLRMREPERWRQTMRPYIPQDSEAWGSGDRWIGDHKQLDLWCLWGGSVIRPWLTAWLDWRTRRTTGWVLSASPNSTTILAALRHGLLDARNMGGPFECQIDNGKDYDSWTFHGQTKKERRSRINLAVDEGKAYGIFNALKIEPHFSIPRNPNGKSRIERWFRTLDSFCKTFETYCGEGVESKPERLNSVLGNRRMIPKFAEVQARLAKFIEGDNASSEHDIADLVENGERLSANEAMRRWRTTRRVYDEGSLDLLLQQLHRPVYAGRGGITLTLAGRAISYGQFEPALTRFKARFKKDRRPLLVSYDPHDLRTVRVFDSQWRFVCLATMNDVGGQHGSAINLEHVAELSRQKALYEKSLKHIAQHSLIGVLTKQEQLVEIANRSASKTEDEDSSMRIIPTPVDGQAKQVQRAEYKKAVGAESMSEPVHSGLAMLQQLAQNTPPSMREEDEFSSDPWAAVRSQADERATE